MSSYQQTFASFLGRVYVVALSFAVVPRSKARIHTQMSAVLSDDDIKFTLQAFTLTKQAVL